MAKGDFLGEFEIYVMLALAHLDPDAYGVTIRRDHPAHRPEIAIGVVYATLSRLEEKGLVAYTLSDPVPVPGGRNPEALVLTPAGVRALDHSTRMLARMMQGWRPRTQPHKPCRRFLALSAGCFAWPQARVIATWSPTSKKRRWRGLRRTARRLPRRWIRAQVTVRSGCSSAGVSRCSSPL